MEYIYQEPPEKHNGQHWFGHEIKLYLVSSRIDECWQFITNLAGPKGTGWRLKKNSKQSINAFYAAWPGYHTIRFAEKNRAAMFKLTWEEDDDLELAWAERLNTLFGKMTLNSSFGRMAQSSQSVGRGLRNINMKSVRPSGPSISPVTNSSAGVLPAYDFWTKGLVSNKTMLNQLGVDKDVVFLDIESAYDPTWLARLTEPKPNPRKYEILKGRATTMTTQQLQLRIDHGIQHQEATVPEATQALPERVLIVDEVQQATGIKQPPTGL